MIYIITTTHNSKKMLSRAVDSVLRQSYSDFVYYLIDCATTDETRQMICNYALKDKRIRVVYDNDSSNIENILSRKFSENDYICTLDVNHAYDPIFLETMLQFASEYDLDIACCGSDKFGIAEEVNSSVSVDKTLVLKAEEFSTYFTEYFEFMKFIEGKLYRATLGSKCIEKNKDSLGNCTDLDDFEKVSSAFQNSQRIGFFSKILHYEYANPEVITNAEKLDNFHKDNLRYEQVFNYLMQIKADCPRNIEFLLYLYMNGMEETLQTLLTKTIKDSEKIDILFEILMCPASRKLASESQLGTHFGQNEQWTAKRNRIFVALRDWLLSREEVSDEQVERYCAIGEIAAAITETSDAWISFKKIRVQFLVENKRYGEANTYIKELRELIPQDSEVASINYKLESIMSRHPQKVAIIGVNDYGMFLKQRIDQSGDEYNLIVFCDETGKSIDKYLDNKKIVSLEVLTQMYKNLEIDTIIIANVCNAYRAIQNALRLLGVPEFYVVNQFYYMRHVEKGDLASELIRVDVNKPDLKYYETHVVDHCNLNCKACSHYCNLIKEPKMCDLEQYHKDVRKLGDLWWNVSRLRLMGGEPLLNPELPEWIKVTREVFPAADLSVVTNGLLLGEHLAPLFEVMRNCRCVFHISAYPPIYEKREQVAALLKKHGVYWGWSGDTIPIQSFNKSVILNESYIGDPADSWTRRKCGSTILCNFLRDGYLYPCGSGALNYIFEDCYGVKTRQYFDTEVSKLRIDLHNTKLDGWELNNILDKPHEACRYCNPDRKIETVPWTARGKINVPMCDWVIDC
ncbi:glycosyltransferase [Lacrimispora amygdalina]|uniref:Glycosyltransferase n=1 Tax=Lacrimispora amygdalina TaxID=253257 RepID=A0A3E2NH82_9FIRM|nr:glycosyltransferase [Clostridium indicum]RFZ80349.1 glycosyltransferase [Clostridium indicum]